MPPAALRRRLSLYALLLPFTAGAALLVIFPALASLGLAFFDYDALSPPRWAGMGNFARALADPFFAIAVQNSLVYLAMSVPLRLLAALGLALLLNPSRPASGVYRAAVMLPSIIPDAAYALAWGWILNPLYGPLNPLLRLLGLPAPAWLADSAWAKPALALMALFQVGEGFLVLLAGLKSRPAELLDAARVDGAGRWQVLRYITLPLLRPWLLLMAVRDITLALQNAFAPAALLTGGGPYYSTLTLPLLIFEQAFDRFRFGLGAAMLTLALLLAAGLAALAVLLYWLSGREWERKPPSPNPFPRAGGSGPTSQKNASSDAPSPAGRAGWEVSGARRGLGAAAYHLLAGIIAAACLAPLLFMALAALRPAGLPPSPGLAWPVEGLSLANFTAVFELLPFGRYALNSLGVSLAGALLSLLAASWAGFAMARLGKRGRATLLALTLALLLIPAAALWLTRFLLYRSLGWIDTPLALLAPALIGANPLFVLLFYRAFRSLPAELFEAARLDGAGMLQTWQLVALPLARPASLAVGTLSFVIFWNDFIQPLLYLKSPQNYTLAVGIQQLQQLDLAGWPVLLAGALLMTLPPVLGFLLIQRAFLSEGRLFN